MDEITKRIIEMEKEAPYIQREFYRSLVIGVVRVLVWWPIKVRCMNIWFMVSTFFKRPWLRGKIRYKYERIVGRIKYGIRK